MQTFKLTLCVLTALSLGACTAGNERSLDASESGTGESGDDDPTTDPTTDPIDDTSSSEVTTSPGTDPTDSETDGPTTEETGVENAWHDACGEPLPDVLPEPPPVNMDGDKPAFTQWEGLDCEAVAGNWDFCNGPDDPPCDGACLSDGPDQRGVCTYFDVDIWCDGEGEVMGYGDGACWMCAPHDAKAIACCAELPGFDCRIWPYEFNGGPGDVCATHENCEPGLLCGASTGSGYGICVCPEVTGAVGPEDQCYN